MKGDRKQYRICVETEWPDGDDFRISISKDKRRFGSLAAAQKRLHLYGSTPWLAFGKGPDDPWCWQSPPCGFCDGSGFDVDSLPECQARHSTAREFFEAKAAERIGRVVRSWIEVRAVSPWSRERETQLRAGDSGSLNEIRCQGAGSHIGGFCHHSLGLRDRKGGDPDEWPEDLRVREFPETNVA